MSFKQNIVAQFKQPHGFLGRLAGFIMANRPSNIERNEWTLDLLALAPTDRVLEIGFGPGIAIERTSQMVTRGVIVGIDHSEAMLHQAKKRNATAMAEGRVQLYLGSAAALPHFDEPFDKIFSTNVVQFWDDPAAEFATLYQRLAPGGVIATTYMPRLSGATDADTRRKAEEVVACVEKVGFMAIKVEEKAMKPVSAICVLARKGLEPVSKQDG